jgi:hypothetical protein
VASFLEALEPLFCVLSAIDHILLPHQYQPMEKMMDRLAKIAVDDRELVDDLLPRFCLPFPILELLCNYSRPTALYDPIGQGRDWVVHAHFGDFSSGVVELPASLHAGVCEPGTVTAAMASYIPHGFPPVSGERFILTQRCCTPLKQYLGIRDLPPSASPSLNNVVIAVTTEDDRIASLREQDHQVYKWKVPGG